MSEQETEMSRSLALRKAIASIPSVNHRLVLTSDIESGDMAESRSLALELGVLTPELNRIRLEAREALKQALGLDPKTTWPGLLSSHGITFRIRKGTTEREGRLECDSTHAVKNVPESFRKAGLAGIEQGLEGGPTCEPVKSKVRKRKTASARICR